MDSAVLFQESEVLSVQERGDGVRVCCRQSVYDIQCCRGRGRLFTCNVHSHHSVRNTITAFVSFRLPE